MSAKINSKLDGGRRAWGLTGKGAAAFFIVLAALVIFGGSACGGGGGGSSTSASATTATNTTTAGTASDVHVVGALVSNANVGVDPADMIVGDQIQLSISELNSSGQLVSVSGSNWKTNAPASVATVTSSGLLSAISPSGSATYTLSGTGPLGAVTTTLTVYPASQPILTGLVRDKNDFGITQVQLLFFDSSGDEVAESMTGANGAFRASVPLSATQFTININLADPLQNGTSIFYRQFEYAPSTTTFVYLDDTSGCLTPLITLSKGTNALPGPIVLDDRASGPPPPPTGCASN